MIMFLTKNELHELTSYKYKTKQIMWLRTRGYKFEIAANGHPKVLREYVITLLGKTHIISSKSYPRVNKPNFDFINNS